LSRVYQITPSGLDEKLYITINDLFRLRTLSHDINDLLYDQLTVHNASDDMTNASTLYDPHDHFISSDDHDTIAL